MRLANFDLNLLPALDALLNEQSVSRAAERLHIGQPAMSATLARLRSAFGDPLLVRSGRGLRRSGFADSLQEPVAEILRSVGHLLEAGEEFDPGTSHRTFTIVASDYVALILLRTLLERLSVIAPNVGVHVTPVGEKMMDNLGRGLVDLAIYPSEMLFDLKSFHAAPLFSDDFVCVTDAANLGVGEVLSLERLSTLPYLAVQQGELSSVIDKRLDEAGVSRNTTMTAQSFVMAPFMLPGTRMYTIVQRKLAELLMPEAHFRMDEPPVPVGTINEVMVWPHRRTVDPGHAWLRDELTVTARQLRLT